MSAPPPGPGPARPPVGGHNVLPQAAQTHLQVVPSASGNCLLLPLPTCPPCPACPGPSLSLAEVPPQGAVPAGPGGLCPLAPGWRTAPVAGLPGSRALRAPGNKSCAAGSGCSPSASGSHTSRAGSTLGKQDLYRNEVLRSLESARARLFWKVVSCASGVWAGFARSAGRDEEKAAGATLLCRSLNSHL